MIKISCSILFCFCFFCFGFKNEESNNTSNIEEFKIPFKLIDNRIAITVKLNNQISTTLFVDNGCTELMLTEKFIKQYTDILHLKKYPQITAVNHFLTIPAQKAYIAQGEICYHIEEHVFINTNLSGYTINNEKIKDFIEVFDNDYFNELQIDGIIPLRCLATNGIIKINNNEHYIEFPTQIDTLAIEYNYQLKNKLQIIQFPITFVDTQGQAHCHRLATLLDLGFNSSNLLFKNSRTKAIENYADKNIRSSERHLFFQKVKMGSENTLMHGCTMHKGQEYHIFDLLIGMEILSNYDLYFDYMTNKIYVRPLSKELFYLNDSTSIIAGICLASDFFVANKITSIIKTDIRLGDIVLKIDNTYVQNISRDSLLKIRKISNDNISQQSIVVKRGKDTLLLQRVRK
ncbi:MAG: hypothetical protein LBK03_03915 [Bacteroidales bacterium]|jgi:hypothetical protein|nr:hypothetical protein [Bacteroidales bacterium]